jgi:raffinose/stachyose/melibiose transport system substrate-binding protein
MLHMIKKGRSLVVIGSVSALFLSALTGLNAASAASVSTTLTKKPITLVIADETGFPLTDKLSEEFTKQFPNVKFKINRDSFANLTANAPRLMASNNAPDLIRLPTMGDAVKNKLLLNLDPYFKAYGWDKWSAAQLAGLRMNAQNVRGSGSLYQLGLGYSVTGIFMNMNHAKTLGITAPPQTWQELEDDLAKAKAAGILPIMAGDKDGVVNFAVQAAINVNTDRQMFSDWIYCVPGANYYTPGAIKGADKIREWADKGYFPSDINAIDYFTFITRFQNGEGLFEFNGNWESANLQGKLGQNVKFFLVPPLVKGGKHVAMGAANSFSVPAKSKNKDAIVFFLNWIHTNPKARQITLDVTGATPGGDPKLPLPKVVPGSLIEDGLKMAAQLSKDNGYIDFMANATAGIYANAIIPQSQLLVASKITGKEFVSAVQDSYAKELGNK